MASSSSFFHSYARKSRVIGLGITLAIAGFAIVAPGGCTLPLDGLSAGGGGASVSITTTTTSSTATTTTSSTATSTSTGCMQDAGCMPCVVDADCGAPTFDGCTVSTCVGSVCTPKSTAGMMSATQTAHDCKVSVCGPDGMPMLTPDPSDTPIDDLNPCTKELCVNGAPTTMFVATGTSCLGGTCDGAGACTCTNDTECTIGKTPTCNMMTHACVSCSDGVMNGKETAPDCGGNCGKCGGDTCGQPTDCASSQCADNRCCDTDCTGACKSCNLPGSPGICTDVPAGQPDPGTCADPALACNGGGACKNAAGGMCAVDGDCGSNVCLGGLCRTETGGACTTDLTCASGRCVNKKCADCSAASDCASMVCGAPTCKTPGGAACDVDGDCAGNKCQFGLCLGENGSPCGSPYACRSGVCSGGQCMPCGFGFPCAGGASCGVTVFGTKTCNRPIGSYCSSNTQCEGLAPCLGFPKTCQ